MRRTTTGRVGTIAMGLALVAGAVVLVAPSVQAATYVVTTTADSGEGSLRDAITAANSFVGADVITFDLPGDAPFTILLPVPVDTEPAFPTITDALTIDGTSQDGYAGVPLIQIVEANNAPARPALRVQAPDVTITGLSFVGFDTGVDINFGASDTVVSDSQFGMTSIGNGIDGAESTAGVLVQDGSGHVIRDNYISNAESGVLLNGIGITGTTIQDNSMGISRDGTTGLPVRVGIEVLDSGFGNALDGNRIIGDVPDSFAGIKAGSPFGLTITDNLIGVLTPGGGSFPGPLYGMYFTGGGSFGSFTGNEIAGAQDDGIRMESESGVFQSTIFGNTIRGNVGDGIDANATDKLRTLVSGNSIYENGGLGINVGGDEFPNSPPDAGPLITDATPGDGDATATVSYDGPASAANASVQVAFWTNSSCDPSEFGEGETPLHYETGLELDENGDFTDKVIVIDAAVNPGDILTAIVDGGDVDFTEFSNCYELGPGANNPPVAMVDLEGPITLPADTTADIQLYGTDADGDALTFIPADPDVGTVGSPGAVDCDDTTFGPNTCTQIWTYSPPVGYSGDDSFAFDVCDPSNACDTGVIPIFVEGAGANNPPVAQKPAAATTPAGVPVDIVLEGSDADGDALTFAIDTPPTNGSVDLQDDLSCLDNDCTITATYTPNEGFDGADGFEFSASDGDLSSEPAGVDITVEAAVNATPVAIGFEGPVTTTMETPVDIQLFGTDADGDALTFLAGDPELGAIGNPGVVDCDDDTFGPNTCTQTWTYTPPIEYTGPDSFAFQVCDPSNACDSIVVDILVEGAEGGADLTLQSLTDAPDPVTSGGAVAVVAQVKNLGPDAAVNPIVDFADPDTGSLPPGVTFVGGLVSSSLGGSGSCAQSEAGSPVTCTLGAGSIPADAVTTWTVTVYLQTSAGTANAFDIRARASSDTFDPVADNALTETTTVAPAGDDNTTEYVPPSNQTETVATSGTALVGGQPVPIAQPGDTTAAAISVPPGGPGGVVTIDELDCEPPFCAEAAQTALTTPTNPPIDDRVIQFVPPTAQYYDYQHPVRYSITYDATVIQPFVRRKLRVLYTKDSAPEQLLRARWCPTTASASTTFPCLERARILRTRNPQLRGDLLIVLRGTYNDPKIAGFR